MKMNKIFKIVLAALLLVTLLGIAGSVFADEIPSLTSKNPGTITTSLNTALGKVLFVVQMVGMAVAVIMLIVLGIKFITASPDGKAEIKKSAWIYCVGAAGIFAASLIVGALKSFFENAI